MLTLMTRWLFLRGLGREIRHWEEFPALFSSTLTCGTLVLDLPGVGTAKNEVAPTSVTRMVELLRQRWRQSQTDAPWNIFGLSLGAMVALEWCHRYPKDFGRAVLVSASARNAGMFWQRLQPSGCWDLGAAALRYDPFQREQVILRMTSAHHSNNLEIAKKWARYATETPLKMTVFLHQLYAAARFSAPAPAAHMPPLLFLAGKADRMVNPICTQNLADYYKAPLHMHPTAGHDVPLDDPKWVVEIVRNSLT